MIKRLLPIYLAAVFGALVGTFWATPYEEVQEETATGAAAAPAMGCCDHPQGAAALLHVPDTMRHRAAISSSWSHTRSLLIPCRCNR